MDNNHPDGLKNDSEENITFEEFFMRLQEQGISKYPINRVMLQQISKTVQMMRERYADKIQGNQA
jgi:hypothetical protein